MTPGTTAPELAGETDTDPETKPEADPGAKPEADLETGTGGLPAKAMPLVRYLHARVREEGAFYEKSRFVAEDLDLSAKEVGAFMRRLGECGEGPEVEAWAYTNGTTWYVSPGE